MTMTSTTDVSSDGITIRRVFDAPRELVFAAWTELEQFAQWYGGPDATVPLETASMDARPGGRWSIVMLAGPERNEIPFSGEFREVVPPERVVFTLTDQVDPENQVFDLVTVVLADAGNGRTEMLFTQTGGHMPEAGYRAAAHGWNIFFDTLAKVLAALDGPHEG